MPNKRGMSPFAAALRWLRTAKADEPVPELIEHPERPGRFKPRVVKRRPKNYRGMTRPRAVLNKALKTKHNSH